MADNMMFRVSSFGGFNKDDVMKYIEQMNFKIKQISEENSVELAQIKKELAVFNEICEQNGIENLSDFVSDSKNQKDDLEDLQKRCDGYQKEKKELATQIANLKEENEKLSAVIRVKNSNIDEQIKVLHSEKLELVQQNTAYLKEIQGFANMKDDVVKLELEAHIRAKSILDEAKTKAAKMIDEASIASSNILSDNNKLLDEIIAKNVEKCNKIKQNSLEEIEEAKEIYQKIAELTEGLERKNSKINMLTEEYEQVIKNSLDGYIEKYEQEAVK